MEVERIKRSSDVRREFMALYLHDEDIRRESLEQGRIETLLELVKDGVLSKEQAAERLNMTLEQFEQKIEQSN